MIIRFEDARRDMAKVLRKDKKLRQAHVRAISATLYKKQKERMETSYASYTTKKECNELAEEILKVMFEERE